MLSPQASRALAIFGRACFGAALVGLGCLQFVFGDFLVGRAPAWPEELPGRLAFACLTGLLFAASGLAIGADWKTREAAILAGAMILTWALARNVVVLATSPNVLVLTFTGKAIALCGGAFMFSRPDPLIRLGALCLGAFMAFGGWTHFAYTAFAAQLIPSWIPAPVFWTYLAGAALIAGGVGMNIARVRPLASLFSGLMIFSWVLVLHLPRAFAATTEASRRNEWTAALEALAFAGTALFIAGVTDRRT